MKKETLVGVQSFYSFFQRGFESSFRCQCISLKDLTENSPSFLYIQRMEYSISGRGWKRSTIPIRVVTSPTSQSFKFHRRLMFQAPSSVGTQQLSTFASLFQTMLNMEGDSNMRGLSEHHLSFQNLILDPEPRLKVMPRLNSSATFIIALQHLQPYEVVGVAASHSLTVPYLQAMTRCHRLSLSCPNLHNHFDRELYSHF